MVHYSIYKLSSIKSNKPNTLWSIITLFLFLASLQPNISEHHSNKTVQEKQRAEQQLMLLFNVRRGRRGLGNVEAVIVVYVCGGGGRRGGRVAGASYQRNNSCRGKRNNNLWHLPLVVIIVDIFTAATSTEQSGVSLETHLRDRRITAFDWYSGCGGAYCQNCEPKQKCGLLKFWFRLALVFPHIHLYCLGRGLGIGTYRKRYYLINKCARRKYLTLFFGAMISLDAKRDRQSR